MANSYEWNPVHPTDELKFMLGSYGLLILNRPIFLPPEPMLEIWNNATVRATADGGTDRWFAYLRQHQLPIENNLPHIVSGDFDSISPDTLEYCTDNGVYVEKTPDVNNTDFTKALTVMAARCKEKLDSVVVIIDNSGRLDHTFSNLNTLHKALEIFGDPNIKVYLLTLDSITWLLHPGHHKIHIPEALRTNYDWCGLLPFATKPSKVTTTGLKWNLCKSSIEFGGLISSSNTYNGESYVTVTTDTALIWCMSLDYQTQEP